MKTSLFILSVLGVLLFTSCQKPKDWTCTCNCTPIGGTSSTQTAVIHNAKQSDASTTCNEMGKNFVGGNGSWACSIK